MTTHIENIRNALVVKYVDLILKGMQLLKSKKRKASWLAFLDFFPPNGRMNLTQNYNIIRKRVNFFEFSN